MSLIRTRDGWRLLAPLPLGAIAARARRDIMVDEISALCPGLLPGEAARLATAILADLLSHGVAI